MKIVEGVEISGYGHEELAQDLEMYCNISSMARDHLRAASQVKAKIEIQRAGNICHADKNVVKVSRDACLDQATGLTSMIYLTESVLFELQNAINFTRYQQFRKDAMGGSISILQYGLGFSNLEFESTVKTVQILTQVRGAGQPISPWGEKQFSGYAKGPNNFANQPHDPKSAGEQRLPSKLFYAYSYLQDSVKLVKNMKPVLGKLATIKKGQKSMNSLKWSLFRSNFGRYYENNNPAQFLVTYIDALLWLDNEVGWSVIWEGGTMADWKLCALEFVNTVPTVHRDQSVTKAIKKDFETEITK